MIVGWQLQQVAGKLLHRQTKTDASDAELPFPEIVTTALRQRPTRFAEPLGKARAVLHAH
jgi:hypothetical protein